MSEPEPGTNQRNTTRLGALNFADLFAQGERGSAAPADDRSKLAPTTEPLTAEALGPEPLLGAERGA
jgi:hypothetical protein